MYELPAAVNRESESWMWKQWGPNGGYGCDPVYNRRIYAAQSHFDSQVKGLGGGRMVGGWWQDGGRMVAG